MATRIGIAAALVLAGGVGSAAWLGTGRAAAPAAVAADSIEWLHDLAEGEALAAKLGKPLLLVFRCER